MSSDDIKWWMETSAYIVNSQVLGFIMLLILTGKVDSALQTVTSENVIFPFNF